MREALLGNFYPVPARMFKERISFSLDAALEDMTTLRENHAIYRLSPRSTPIACSCQVASRPMLSIDHLLRLLPITWETAGRKWPAGVPHRADPTLDSTHRGQTLGMDIAHIVLATSLERRK